MTDDKNSATDSELEDVELGEPEELEIDEETEALIADVPQELTESEDEDGESKNGGT